MKSNYYDTENLKLAFQYVKNELSESKLTTEPVGSTVVQAIEEFGDNYFSALSKVLKENKYYPDKASFLYSSKDNMGVRPIGILSITDRIIAQAILNPEQMGIKIDKHLFNFAYGNRLSGKEKYLCDYKPRMNKFCDDQVKAFKNGYKWQIEFDLKGFYENILINKLCDILKNDFCVENNELIQLENLLNSWTEVVNSKIGIPQGPYISHILANAYLHPLDSLVNELKNEKDFCYFRYVDDMVVMAKNPEDINMVVSRLVIFIRELNLKLNEKTKVNKLKNIQPIEERRISSNVSEYSYTTDGMHKVEIYRKNIPKTIKKIKSFSDNKKEISNLRYFLKASNELEKITITDGLIECVLKKPSMTEDIVRFLGSQFMYYSWDDSIKNKKEKYIKDRCFKVWNIYKQENSEWVRFWLIKLLFQKEFYEESESFRKELNSLTKNKESNLLKLIGYYYFAYLSNNTDLVFSFNELRSQINKSKNEIEKSSFLYFLIYFKDTEDTETITELAIDYLSEKSIDIQLMSLFVLKKIGWKSKNIKKTEAFTKHILNIPFETQTSEITQLKQEEECLTFEGKINKDQFSKLMGTTINETYGSNKKYSDASEDIFLKTLGIKIKGNYIIKGKEKREINVTDKALIYFLYYKSIINEDGCFSLDDLSKEESINKSKKYIRNRITILNKLVKEIITKELRTTIPNFIKKEPKKRGYHLNPKIIHIKSKK